MAEGPIGSRRWDEGKEGLLGAEGAHSKVPVRATHRLIFQLLHELGTWHPSDFQDLGQLVQVLAAS